tara:strand:- start:1803 stop:2135 length:333 start_codon:yes stop_codon:yes gene_type:complete
MTNEQAHKIIEDRHGDSDSKSAQLAYIFAMEDLISLDVSEWVETEPEALMEDFLKHAKKVMSAYIEDRYGDDQKTVEALYDLKNRMINTAEAMVTYMDYWWAVKKQVGNG